MTKHPNQRADAARRALAETPSKQEGEPVPECITHLIANLGHLCDAEHLDFIGIVKSAVQHWTVERAGYPKNPDVEGPDVQIIIGQGAT